MFLISLIIKNKQTYLIYADFFNLRFNKFVTRRAGFQVYLYMSSYRLDRTAFKVQTAEEASKSDAAYYRTLSPQERLRIANYLNSIAYNYPENDPPRLDKTVFKIRSRK
jgi:hypothetical protein